MNARGVVLLSVSLLCGACATRSPQPETPPLVHFFEHGADAAYLRFLDQAAAEPGAVRTGSGLVYRELTPGGGQTPAAADRVTIIFVAKTPDGRIVEDSAAHGGAVTVAVADVEPCFREAVLRMRAGGVSRFVCPLPTPDRDRVGQASAPVPIAFEATLIAIGQPLPRPGH